MDEDLESRIDALHAARDREDMAPTIEALEALSLAHPDEPRLVVEVAGAHDTAGHEATARSLYERALRLGLSGDLRRRCLLQYGSTLRNLDEIDASLAVLDEAGRDFPDSTSVAVFRSISLLEAGRVDAAVGTLLQVLATHPVGDLERYRDSTAGNAAYLLERDGTRSS